MYCILVRLDGINLDWWNGVRKRFMSNKFNAWYKGRMASEKFQSFVPDTNPRRRWNNTAARTCWRGKATLRRVWPADSPILRWDNYKHHSSFPLFTEIYWDQLPVEFSFTVLLNSRWQRVNTKKKNVRNIGERERDLKYRLWAILDEAWWLELGSSLFMMAVCDLFGCLEVILYRKRTAKSLKVLFTWLVTRALYPELVDTLSSDVCLFIFRSIVEPLQPTSHFAHW
jgi:hypothetical protein